MKGKLIALALCAGLTFSAVGCASSQAQINRHNASVYVQGVLDETYSGQPQDSYLKLVDHTQEQARGIFEKNLAAEFEQRLALRFELESKYISRDLRRDFLALLDAVYARADYTVKGATPLDDGRYCVELTVTPVTFFASAYADGYAKLRRDFERDHSLPDEDAREDMEPAELRKVEADFEAAWAQAVYDYLFLRLDNITTGPTVTKLVLVTPDSQGIYALSSSDLQDVDDLILQY